MPILPDKEPAGAQRAYLDYFTMGPDRTLQDLVKHYKTLEHPPTTSIHKLKTWAAKYKWEDKIYEANNRLLSKIELDHQVNWERERLDHRDRMLDLGKSLLDKAGEMLRWPLATMVRDVDGRPVTVNPAKWSFSDVSRMVEVADKMIRLAAEMETDRTKIDVDWEIQVRQMAEAQGLTPEETEIALQTAEGKLREMKLLPPPQGERSA